jgi:uncharacterized DUF497 family protein
MRYVTDFDAQLWLQTEWDGTLDWDDANAGKLKKHSVSVAQVESLLMTSLYLPGGSSRRTGKTGAKSALCFTEKRAAENV